MRCWQLADKMKAQRGPLEGDSEFNDNNRIKRYVAKYTINPAITNGIADYIGSVEVGNLQIWLSGNQHNLVQNLSWCLRVVC